MITNLFIVYKSSNCEYIKIITLYSYFSHLPELVVSPSVVLKVNVLLD